ncbi:hypothetical protein J6590_108260 [Homalodisca vitripennis]|nr:hypothetical protein J6590_108260 [Homalodisca vitripennis]
MYFNLPEQPENASKTYYIDEMISCLKFTFRKARSEASYQSIDESMAKFKGRSSLKQYLPLKPIKRGIKLWERCDAETGYCYDLNVYVGKETENVDGTLGERVIEKLLSSIRGDKENVALSFDRFFTSVNILNTISHPCGATCISNRKNMPHFDKKLEKGEFDFLGNDLGVLAARWKDSKEFVVLSNFHKNTVTNVQRMQKNGEKQLVPCPESTAFYNEIMGGVDLSDQKVSIYDFDRKSKKWWKKVFYKLLLTSVVNAWILYEEIQHKKTSLLSFVVPPAEQLLCEGRKKTSVKRRMSCGRPSKRAIYMVNVGSHLPVEGTTIPKKEVQKLL